VKENINIIYLFMLAEQTTIVLIGRIITRKGSKQTMSENEVTEDGISFYYHLI
jgi:hypothetical protein